MLLFYTPDITMAHTQYLLSEDESKHAIRVLRLGVGDHIHLVNGLGDFFAVEIRDAHPKRTVLQVLSCCSAYQQRPYRLHIAVAPTKNIDRLEWFIEKATEIGIDTITPLICDRSERKDVKTERLTKIAVAAMKQSLKAYLPQIQPPTTFRDFMAAQKDQDHLQKGIAHCLERPKRFLSSLWTPRSDYLLLIGPEGDFSEREIEEALQGGFSSISLGDARLRTETAALTATVEIALLNRTDF